MKHLAVLFSAGLILLLAVIGRAAPSEEASAPAENSVVFWELACHDAEKSVGLIEQHGGLLHTEPHEIFPGTWICLFHDPSGVPFAMVEHRTVEK